MENSGRKSYFRLSKLFEVVVYLKAVERQKVFTCNQIFSGETFHSLKDRDNITDVNDTICF